MRIGPPGQTVRQNSDAMKSSSDVLALINRLEHRFPVSSWRAGDIDLWPVHRTRLYMNVTLAMLAAETTPAGPLTRRIRQIRQLARGIWSPRAAAWRDRRMNADLAAPAGAVCLSDGVSFTRIGGRWYDRVMDPLVESLELHGVRTLKLTPGTEIYEPRTVPSVFIQPMIDRSLAMPRRAAFPVHLPDFDAFQREAESIFGAHAPTRLWLEGQARRLHDLSTRYERLMAHIGARFAFVNTFYSFQGFAFVQAAHRREIPCADLQHGLQGDQHGTYGSWANIPATGYSTLPREFWVWSDEELRTINAWRNGTPCHAARVTGNLWRDRWFDDNDPMVGHHVAEARAARRGDRPQALVSLAWGLADEETDKIIRAAKLSGQSMNWWWRLHPVEAHLWRDFSARLERAGLDGGAVEFATMQPLYALIRASDVTLAHSSTVIQEAAVFGVRSVVTADYGTELHANLLSSGMALHAVDDAAIAHAAMTLARQEKGPALRSTNGGIDAAVSAWMTGACPGGSA